MKEKKVPGFSKKNATEEDSKEKVTVVFKIGEGF